jgi:hypothetical protein
VSVDCLPAANWVRHGDTVAQGSCSSRVQETLVE